MIIYNPNTGEKKYVTTADYMKYLAYGWTTTPPADPRQTRGVSFITVYSKDGKSKEIASYLLPKYKQAGWDTQRQTMTGGGQRPDNMMSGGGQRSSSGLSASRSDLSNASYGRVPYNDPNKNYYDPRIPREIDRGPRAGGISGALRDPNDIGMNRNRPTATPPPTSVDRHDEPAIQYIQKHFMTRQQADDGSYFATWKHDGSDDMAASYLHARGYDSDYAKSLIRLAQATFGIQWKNSGNITPEQAVEGEDPNQPSLDDLYPGGGGGGGGGGYGGSVGPIYTPPDRRVVLDNVKAMLSGLVGKFTNSQVESLTDAYMRQHRRQWEGDSGDPTQEVLEQIRSGADYKRIHKLRPEHIDEAQWISRQRDVMEQGGLRQADVNQRSIYMAQGGASPNPRAASIAQFMNTGRTTPEFFNRIQSSANQLARAL